MVSGKWMPGIGDLSVHYAIRERVFVAEQGFAADLEIDEYDQGALHLLVCWDDVPVATGRLVQKPRGFFASRIAVLPAYRGQGVGAFVMRMIMYKARQLGAQEVWVCSQEQAKGFYQSLGFEDVGEYLLEQGAPHLMMRATRLSWHDCQGCADTPAP